MIERLLVRLPFPVVAAARLVPLLSAIISMFLMRSVARRFLAAHAVPIAVGLFASTIGCSITRPKSSSTRPSWL